MPTALERGQDSFNVKFLSEIDKLSLSPGRKYKCKIVTISDRPREDDNIYLFEEGPICSLVSTLVAPVLKRSCTERDRGQVA